MRRPTLLIFTLIAVAGTTFPASAAPPPGEQVALIIGIDKFQGRTRPNIGAVGDANDKRDLLLKNGWQPDRIRMLTDSGATQASIREGLRWFVENCTANAMCVFHYSGHTKQMAAGGEALAEYLWPTDNRFISDAELAGYLRNLKGTAWIDIAACEAAGFDNAISGPRTLFTAASQENEKGYEFPAWSNSVWTGLVVSEGMLKGLADANGDGQVTLDEGLRYGIDKAPGMTTGQPTGQQHPYVAGGGVERWFPPGGSEAPQKRCILFLCL